MPANPPEPHAIYTPETYPPTFPSHSLYTPSTNNKHLELYLTAGDEELKLFNKAIAKLNQSKSS